MKRLQERRGITVAAAIIAGACFTNALAQTVVDEWASAKLPGRTLLPVMRGVA
jgi:hypothetical protein